MIGTAEDHHSNPLKIAISEFKRSGGRFVSINPVRTGYSAIADGAWTWVESPWGRVRCMCRYSEAVEPGTVWTWNAIGKTPGAWNLDPAANEARLGFLLDPLISEELPAESGRVSNSDPVTGQAGWYDVRVRIAPAAADEPAETWPPFAPMPHVPGVSPVRRVW